MKYNSKLHHIFHIDNKESLLLSVETNSLFKITAKTANNFISNTLEPEEENELNLLYQNNVFYPFNKEIILNSHPLVGENLAININLTSECNLNCFYCFAQGGGYGETSPHIMKDTSLPYIEEYITKNISNTNTVRIEFFGGEPLLNTHMMREIFNSCECLKKDKGFKFIYRISTNLTHLTQEVIELFKSGNFIVSISIDGNKSTHDSNRPGKAGKSYFNTIIENTKRLRENCDKLTLVARMTASLSETSFLADFDFLYKLKLFDYFQILPVSYDAFLKMQTNLSTKIKSTLSDDEVSYDNIIEELNFFTKKYHEYFSANNIFRGNLEWERVADLIINNKITNSFCSAGRNYHTISHDYSIYPCHRFINNLEFLNGNTKCSNYTINRDWHKSYLLVSKCSSCWARYLCGGGCKQQNYIFSGNINVPSTKGCEIEKKILSSLLISVINQNSDYFSIDRNDLDRLFVSCGRPTIKTKPINTSSFKNFAYFRPITFKDKH